MKKKFRSALNVFMTLLLIVTFTSFSVPASAVTFYEQFITDCEGETWLEDFAAQILLEKGVSPSADKTAVSQALASVTEMTVQNKGISKIPKAIKYFPNLRSVDLSYNKLTDISPLSVCTGIESLVLDGNYISSVDLSAFSNLSKISLAYNSFTVAPVLSKNTKLTHIDFSNNRITAFPTMAGRNSITYFDFSGNKITSGTSLGSFSMKTGDNCFRASWNEITDLSFLSGIRYLETVDLSHNNVSKNISKIPTTVKNLDLSFNKIKDASELAYLTSLTELNLSGNQIGEIDSLQTLTALVSLNVSDNSIVNATKLGFLTNLEMLDISGNGFTVLPLHSLLRKLRVLDISDNEISNVGLISRYVSIEELYASNNKIEDASAISGMTKLNVADFSDNLIEKVDPELYRTVPSLDIIKLSGNPLSADGVKNLLANGFPEVWLENTDLSGKIPDMSKYSVWELYVSGSTLQQSDVNNIFAKKDYTGLGLGGLINSAVISELKKQNDLITLDVSKKPLSKNNAKAVSELNVVFINMSGCSLTEADEIISSSKALSIDLSDNAIKSVSGEALAKAEQNGTLADFSGNGMPGKECYLYYSHIGFGFSDNYTELNRTLDFSVLQTSLNIEINTLTDFTELIVATERYTGKTVKLPTGSILVSVTNGIADKLSVTNGAQIKTTEKIYPYEKYTLELTNVLDRTFSVFVEIRTEIFPYEELTVAGLECIDGIEPGTTFNDIYSKISLASRYTFKAIDPGGNEVRPTSAVSTGSTIKVYAQGKEVLTRTVLIYGDCNGDGTIDELDFLQLKRHLYGQKTLDGLFAVAADVAHSGELDKNDLKLLMNGVLGQENIVQ